VCLELKAADEFYPKRDPRATGGVGLSPYCRPCTKTKNAEYYRGDRDRIRAKMVGDQLWYRYKMTPSEYASMLERQGGVCAVCCAPPGDRRLSVDHDHACCPEPERSCGVCVRGILCQKCNLLEARMDVDEFVESVRRSHPGHSDEWYEVYLRRLTWYVDHSGDMAGAPVLPAS
jgi:hypothetical protein